MVQRAIGVLIQSGLDLNPGFKTWAFSICSETIETVGVMKPGRQEA